MEEFKGTKTAKELIRRGTGNFINCTDYDDAIEVITNLENETIQLKERLSRAIELLKEAETKINITIFPNIIRKIQSFITEIENKRPEF